MAATHAVVSGAPRIPGAPRLPFEPQLMGRPRRARGPMSTAAVNVPALLLLLVAVIVLCAVTLPFVLTRHPMHAGGVLRA